MEVKFKVGDIVARKSYALDTMFKIEKLEHDIAQLKGVFFRFNADSPITDLALVSPHDVRAAEVEEKEKIENIKPPESLAGMRQLRKESDFYISGRILHVDGDDEYLERSAKLYEHANVYATTIFVKEPLMAEKVPELVKQLRPNIVVITGHDAVEDQALIDQLEGYRSSKFFVATVNELRKLEPSLDYLIIIAGACQSHFEALIGSGANFASSPKRINIHALDPAIVAASIALTPYEDEVDLKEALEKTVTKIAGIGGLQTKGTLRYGLKS
ncbi:MAG: sporulation peptidase YabG [Defluviitaleaceae bacterium]|nr:sporulation peptidase YabG [Defluviitaleaceae bacterium]